MPDAQHLPRGAGESATRLRRNDRSGLIDIRALSSVIDAQRRAEPTTSASSVALPSFGSAWALHDLNPPSVAVAVSPIVPARPRAQNNRPLYAMIAVLSIAVLSLGTVVALRGSTTVAAASPPPEVVAPVVVAEEFKRADAGTEAKHDIDPEAMVAEADGTLAADAEPRLAAEAALVSPPKTRRPKNRTRTRRSTPEVPTTPNRADASDGVPFACVVNPESCTQTKRGADARVRDEAPDKGPLPKSPTTSQIRAAMGKVKPTAKACARSHGGVSGDRVRVKISIEGRSGTVKSATPLGEHKGSGLGHCVAKALSRATFPRFTKPQVGLEYAVRL